MRPSRAVSILILLAIAPACRKPGVGPAPPEPSTSPPTAAVTAPIGTQTGIFAVTYTLSDADSNKVSIVVEWSIDAGMNYSPATRALVGGDGTTNLSTSPGGTLHTFVWDSAVDGLGKPADLVRFKVTPSDSALGTEGTADFNVDNTVTVFRIDTNALRDPHMFFFFSGCKDITDSGNGIPNAHPGGVNGEIQDSLTTDGDGDGIIDSSPLLLFRMFNQSGAGGKVELAKGRFAVGSLTSGDLMPATSRTSVTYTNVAAGTLLSPGVGTTHGYTPAIVEPTGPGFVTDPVLYSLQSGNNIIPMEGFRMAASYVGDPATGLINGLSMGFISQSNADSIIMDLGAAGTRPLSQMLAGGGSCASADDRELGPDGVTLGWWFYYNWTAQKVTYTGP